MNTTTIHNTDLSVNTWDQLKADLGLNKLLEHDKIKEVEVILDPEKKQRFTSSGLIYGRYWGGGEGSYPAKNLASNVSEEHLISRAKEALKNGSLDSGMGYQELLGAFLTIKTFTTITIDEDEFINESTDYVFIGDLTEEQQAFLEQQTN